MLGLLTGCSTKQIASELHLSTETVEEPRPPSLAGPRRSFPARSRRRRPRRSTPTERSTRARRARRGATKRLSLTRRDSCPRARTRSGGSRQHGGLRCGELFIRDNALRVQLGEPSELARDVLSLKPTLVWQSGYRLAKSLQPLVEQGGVLRPCLTLEIVGPGFHNPNAYPSAAPSRVHLDVRLRRQ